MRYTVENTPDGTHLHLNETITAADREAFEGVCDAALAGNPATVTVDLSGLEYMDSAGLGFLLILLKATEDKGTRICLSGARGGIAEQLELARFHLLFEIEEAA